MTTCPVFSGVRGVTVARGLFCVPGRRELGTLWEARRRMAQAEMTAYCECNQMLLMCFARLMGREERVLV